MIRMKQFLSIVTTVIYLVLSTGLQVNAHYCHGELESVKVLVQSDPCCCGEGDMQSSCCSNENISFQADIDNHVTTDNRISLDQYELYADIQYSIFDIRTETGENQTINYDCEVPPILKQPLWLLNCTFTFYG